MSVLDKMHKGSDLGLTFGIMYQIGSMYEPSIRLYESEEERDEAFDSAIKTATMMVFTSPEPISVTKIVKINAEPTMYYDFEALGANRE